MQQVNQGSVQRARFQNAMALAAMFDRPLNGALYLPRHQEHQIVAADIDGDGQEDNVQVRLLPLTGEDGLDIAAGASEEIEFEPLRWCQILNFFVEPSLTASLVLTNFSIGQDNQFPRNRGALPLSTFAATAVDKMIDVPWCGPGVPLQLTIKNVHASVAATFYGGARVRAVLGKRTGG